MGVVLFGLKRVTRLNIRPFISFEENVLSSSLQQQKKGFVLLKRGDSFFSQMTFSSLKFNNNNNNNSNNNNNNFDNEAKYACIVKLFEIVISLPIGTKIVL